MEIWSSKTWKTWIKEFCDKKNVVADWNTREDYAGLGLQTPTFTSHLRIKVGDKTLFAEASAKSKKEAEQEAARTMILTKMSPAMKLVINPDYKEVATSSVEDSDPISSLKMLCDQRKINQPSYSDEKIDGPPHARVFTVTCSIPALGVCLTGTGKTKKDAKKSAASQTLIQLKQMGYFEDNASRAGSFRPTHEQSQGSHNYISSDWTRERFTNK